MEREPPAHKNTVRALSNTADDTENLLSSSKEQLSHLEAKPGLSWRPHSPSKLEHAPAPTQHHVNDYVVHEITNVPAPIPDTGLPPPSDDTTAYNTPPPTSTSPSPKASSTRSHAAPQSTFIPLPPLKTLNLTSVKEAVMYSPPVVQPIATPEPIQGAAAGVGQHAHPPAASSHHLSTTAIVVLSVSGGLLIFVIWILIRLIKRPRRRKTPTPSLPILQDGTFPDDKFESEGSPIFGGKEHISPTLRSTKGNTGLWAWTQYHSGIPKPAPAVTVTRASSQAQQPNTVNSSAKQEGHDIIGDDKVVSVHQYPFTGIGNVEPKNTGGPPLQPVQNAITRAVSRLSTISMSLYPNSPGGYSQMPADVGLAIDGAALDEQSSSMVPKHKDRIAVPRNRTSMIAPASAKDSAALRRSQSFAYDGMEPTSAAPNREPSNGGRARIKSTYYTPGLYPRTSTAPTSYPRHDHNREHGGATYHGPGVQRSDSRRGRDLTSALGLASPIPPSPQPTLYPDDSMSVIGEAKKVMVTGRSQKKPVPKQSFHYDRVLDSPPTDTAALGSLMMVDFAASKSTASLVNIRLSEAARTQGRSETPNGYSGPVKTNLKKRVADKPPRVPSPPPIPSLAQMALQHTNPEAYADYHSPTYSIYGLYDGDRKSRGTSFGY
ncbi:hypothetical protein BS17DRAFT_799915 [Gyrodon lividus]|nr:hypothetical protein BS17DRAFT_799915 [Gyrodon lividus]